MTNPNEPTHDDILAARKIVKANNHPAHHGAIDRGPQGRRESRMTENTGALKFDTEKPRVELLPSAPLIAIADVLTFGAKKYAAHNWRQGFDQSRLIGAAMRHLLAYNDGEDIDPESGLSHLAHLGCCVLFLLEHQIKGIGNDDRYGRPK